MTTIDRDTLGFVTGALTAKDRSAAFRSGFDASIAADERRCRVPRLLDWTGLTSRAGGACMTGASGRALVEGHKAVEALENRPNQS